MKSLEPLHFIGWYYVDQSRISLTFARQLSTTFIDFRSTTFARKAKVSAHFQIFVLYLETE